MVRVRVAFQPLAAAHRLHHRLPTVFLRELEQCRVVELVRVGALDRLPVAIVSVYPYVNAIVAVALGWLFYREKFGLREAIAMVVIFASVGVVKRYARQA